MQNASLVAVSRLIAQQRAMDVIATNLANANTPAFKAERVLFSDWLSRNQGPGAPRGGDVVAYTQDRATYRDGRDGALSHTGDALDVAITAEGYFTLRTAAGVRLTRAGHFGLLPDGTIADGDGDALLGSNGQPIQVAATDTQISIAGDGTVSTENGQVGQIAVVRPADEMKLQAEGGRRFSYDGATTPVAAPKLVQGAVEDSNVQPVAEMARMMTALREFQFVGQFVQGEADRQTAAIDKILTRRS